MNRRLDPCTARVDLVVRVRGGAGLMPAPSPRVISPRWLFRRRRRGRGASVSGRDRRGGGGDLAGDFCSPPSSSSRRRPLQRRREGVRWCTGVFAVGRSWSSVCWLFAWSVLGRWQVAGGSGAPPRLRRRMILDPEEEDELGVVPRPTIHRDRWASPMLLLAVHKATLAMELLLLRACWLPSSLLVLPGAGGDRRRGLVVVANPRGCSVVLLSPGGFSANVRVYMSSWTVFPLCVRILYYLCL